jgi:hypothetical protein
MRLCRVVLVRQSINIIMLTSLDTQAGRWTLHNVAGHWLSVICV